MTDPPRIWKTGERCRITFHGKTVDGFVALASESGRSLAITFDALLGGYAGSICLNWEPELSGFFDLIRWQPATLEPIPEHNDPKEPTE
jgi:hypothetical protein